MKRIVLGVFILTFLGAHVELTAQDEINATEKTSHPVKHKKKSKKQKKDSSAKKMSSQAKGAKKKYSTSDKEKDERRHMRRSRRHASEEKNRMKHEAMMHNIHEKDKAKVADLHAERAEGKALAARWHDFRRAEVAHDYELGCFADLYKQPSRPTYATRVIEKHLFNAGVEYNYACDAYSARGVNNNITKLAFGENPVLVQDLLLVSKLAAAGKVTQQEPTGVVADPTINYLNLLADQEVRFLGKAESWGVNLDLARYVWKRNVVFGIQVPIKYMDHKLRADMSPDAIKELVEDPATGRVDDLAEVDSAFNLRYGQDTGKFISDILNAKGISELGGSATGLGDITLFAHVNFDSVRVDNLMAGVRVVVPTAQKATQGKLWAPELGNGGFTEASVFMSAGFFHSGCCNPHLLIQASAFSAANVSRRVPKRITATGVTAAGLVSFGDRITGANAFSEFDTTFRGLADNVARIKITKGQEFNVRLGNMVEKFILRRAFLDVFYDFRAKLADGVSGLNQTDWNADIYKENTQQIEHKAGFEWSYQYDEASRLRTGATYTFAGRNVPKTFVASLAMNYSF